MASLGARSPLSDHDCFTPATRQAKPDPGGASVLTQVLRITPSLAPLRESKADGVVLLLLQPLGDRAAWGNATSVAMGQTHPHLQWARRAISDVRSSCQRRIVVLAAAGSSPTELVRGSFARRFPTTFPTHRSVCSETLVASRDVDCRRACKLLGRQSTAEHPVSRHLEAL